ncbi:1416_t:CDS:1, partial [Racocetra persica]
MDSSFSSDSSFITDGSQIISYNLKSDSSNLSTTLYNNFIDLATDSTENINSTITSSETTNLSNILANATSSTITSNENFSNNK